MHVIPHTWLDVAQHIFSTQEVPVQQYLISASR